MELQFISNSDPAFLANYLRNKRREYHLTQEQLATKSGVSLATIRKIESGSPNVLISIFNQVIVVFNECLEPSKIRSGTQPADKRSLYN